MTMNLEISIARQTLILPLLEGGSSQTVNEALASGLPIVTNEFQISLITLRPIL